MFSKRTNWPLEKNELIVRLEALRQEGKRIIDLTESNPTRCAITYPDSKILRPLSDCGNLRYEPLPYGSPHARQTLAAYYRKKGFEVDVGKVFLVSSTSEAYAFLFRLLLNPTERILVPSPSYPLFQYLADLNDVAVDSYPLVYKNHWSIDLESLKKNIQDKTRAIILVNPNNPTGSFIKKEELAEINKLALHYHVSIICDEVFSDYCFSHDKEIASSLLGNNAVLTFVLGGASKSLGLPQMKLAWGLVSGPKDIVDDALNRLEIILDTYLSANTPAQNSLPEWLKILPLIQKEISRHLTVNKDFIEKNIHSSCGCELLACEGGWYVVLRLPKSKSEDEWAFNFLEKDHVFVHPGYFFDFNDEPYAVLSLLPQPKIFAEGVKRIFERIKA